MLIGNEIQSQNCSCSVSSGCPVEKIDTWVVELGRFAHASIRNGHPRARKEEFHPIQSYPFYMNAHLCVQMKLVQEVGAHSK